MEPENINVDSSLSLSVHHQNLILHDSNLYQQRKKKRNLVHSKIARSKADSMPYLNFTFKRDEVKSFVEDWQKTKSQPDIVPNTSDTNVENASSSLTGEKPSLPTFISSYLNLSDNLKACLAYSSFLTKYYRVEKDKLVRLLVAEGLIVQDDSGNLLEDIASGVIKELISQRMLHQDPLDHERVGVPSPYRELCIKVVNRKDFVAAADPQSCHRLYIFDDGKNNLSPDLESLPIQSLFVITAKRQGVCKSSRLSRAYMETICKLKSLVVLDLDGTIECLPDEIGDLVHLKYLCLSSSNLKELPRTIGKLQKLQTLIIIRCDLEELPVEVFEIQQLRHLIMSKSSDDREIRVPNEIGEMKDLQTLCGVYAGGGIAKEMSKLAQLLNLEVLRVAEEHATELYAAIMKMTNLISLSMEAEISCYDEETHRMALFPEMETFSPPPLLQDVNLTGLLVEMPYWLESMENLTKLCLSFSYLSDNPTSEIQFLPNLKHLTLWQAWKEKVIGKEFCVSGGFPKLETLKIASMFLVEWTEIANGAFPSLKSLNLRNCMSFRFFPNGLEKISTLKILSISPIYDEDLRRRLEGEENYKIKNIPIVSFRTMIYG